MKFTTFDAWMTKVDKHVAASCDGFTSDDLPDVDYLNWFKSGMSAKDAAKRAVEFAKEFD